MTILLLKNKSVCQYTMNVTKGGLPHQAACRLIDNMIILKQTIFPGKRHLLTHLKKKKRI